MTAFTDPTTTALFELVTDEHPSGELEVIRFRGEEAISEAFSYHVEIAAELPFEGLEPALFGQAASLVLHAPGGTPRVIRGIVRAVEARGALASRHAKRNVCSVELVPRLALLRERVNSRIFQEKSVAAITERILEEWGIKCRWALSRRHEPRVYCVQYQETDYDFLLRILAAEGISFYFDSAPPIEQGLPRAPSRGALETLVFGDSARAHGAFGSSAPAAAPFEPVLRAALDSAAMEQDAEQVLRFFRRRTLAAQALRLRDYNPLNERYDLLGESAVPPGADPGAVPGADLSTVYEYLPPRALDGGADDELAADALEQARGRVIVAQGESTSRRLVPGHVFAVDGHQETSLNGAYVVIRQRAEGTSTRYLEGSEALPYRSSFEAIPADRALRPARPARKLQQVLDTAVVVGPAAQEIYADGFGRVKIQFRWDLDNAPSEFSSCWVRVAQGWAGAGFGTHFVPRVGMEVLVSFLGGDVDRPIIVGCVPNSTNPTPYRLPGEQTKSGIITRSTPGGEGYNELTFEDALGSERIFVRAQKDLEEQVQNDHTARVRHDHSLRVDRHQSVHVAGNRSDLVEGDASIHVKGARIDRVDGASARQTTGDAIEEYTRDVIVRVHGGATTDVRGDKRESVAGASELVVKGESVTRLEGTAAVIVGRADAPKSWLLHVNGAAVTESSKTLELVSAESIRLRVGESSILITPTCIQLSSEKIQLYGKTVESTGDTFNVKADKTARLKGDKVFVLSSGAGLGLTGDAKLDGGKVKLKEAPDSGDDPAAKPSTPAPTTVKLLDQDDNPIAGERFVLTLADGSQRAFVSNDQGEASIPGLEGQVKIDFPDLSKWEKS